MFWVEGITSVNLFLCSVCWAYLPMWVCVHFTSSDEIAAVRRLLEKVDLQGYQVMDVTQKVAFALGVIDLW